MSSNSREPLHNMKLVKLPGDSSQLEGVLGEDFQIPFYDGNIYLLVQCFFPGAPDFLPANKECSPKNCLSCEESNCPVKKNNILFEEVQPEKEPIEDTRSTIPGHPNCHVGDCINCRVVSCAIYQGYEEMP